MVSRSDGPVLINTIMTYLTKEEEVALDNKETIEAKGRDVLNQSLALNEF